MISVVNIGPHDDSDPLGERNYEVRIYDGKNENTVATFKHKRSDGLAKCLHRAGDAVELAREQGVARLLEAMKTMKLPSPTANE